MSGLCTLHWSGSHDAEMQHRPLGPRITIAVCRNKLPLGTERQLSTDVTLLHCTLLIDYRGVEISGSGVWAIHNIDVSLHPSSVWDDVWTLYFQKETETGSDKSQSWDTAHVSRASCLQ